ncbi:hypothetical protein COLO4_27107 [Corchorus olitorius]|uniref:Uncharacterized protein n=1 Tax=Corchorus olitorius TaxID=93759 RepID=A0A1R3HTA1_9ROSI|nr:hypothetical protein COLO4_27107 [Corchorus olitorius]
MFKGLWLGYTAVNGTGSEPVRGAGHKQVNGESGFLGFAWKRENTNCGQRNSKLTWK